MDEKAKLVRNIEEAVQRLESAPKNKELEEIIMMMKDITKDIETIINNDFTEKKDFDAFILKVYGYHGIDVYAPRSKVNIAFIESKCLDEKSIYNCLQEKFTNKTPILNVLFEKLSEKLDDYFVLLFDTLFPHDENDP
jgi:hypothetical protein